jgi:hypothetical protein
MDRCNTMMKEHEHQSATTTTDTSKQAQ